MKISDIADIINVTEKEPSNSGIDIFVGLEHYDIAEPVIKRYGSTKMLSTAAKIFEAGDVLIARRNVYLQRASVARFAGLTSGDSIVLRVKKDLNLEGTNYKTICKLLPFILNSINFWDYANTNADGTMSKRLSPAMLLDYEFNLPSIDEQKVLAEKLWAAYEVKQSYLKMIDATDEMVKAQFIEMFGNPLSSVQRYPLKKLGDCCELNPRRPNLTLKDTDKVSFVPMPSVSENGYLQDVTDEEYGKVKKGFTYFENDDVLFAKITPCMENGKGAIAVGLTNNIGMGSTEFHVLRPISDISNPYWLLALTRLPNFRVKASMNMSGTGGQKRVPASYLDNFMVGLPPIELQEQFTSIYKQADKSISELRKSVDAIDKVIKSLINENL